VSEYVYRLELEFKAPAGHCGCLDPWYYNIDMKVANTSSTYVEILWKAPGYPNRTKIHGNSGMGDGVENMIDHSII